MNKNLDPRPLSPHLTIHRKVQTALLSIAHRITGIGLSLGSLLLVFWLLILIMGEEYYYFINIFLNTFIGKLILFVWSLGLVYHLLNGIRYLIWSTEYFMNIKIIFFSGYIVIIMTIFFTSLLWIMALG